MVYTSYFDNIKNIPANIICYSIAGNTPKGFLDVENHRSCYWLMPKWIWWKEWHDKFADNPESDESKRWYSTHYYDTVLKNLNAHAIIKTLQDHSDRDICLLCYEPPEKFCHRHLVADWLKTEGIECREI